MSPRTGKQLEELRSSRKEAILEAALHVFAEEGYHSASVSKISKMARVSKGLMYNYFDSKEALLKELLNSVFDNVMHSMGYFGGQEMNDALMIQHIDKSFEIVKSNRSHWILYFSVITQPKVVSLAMEQMLPKVEPYLLSLYNYFAAKKHKDPQVVARYFCATLDGAQMQYLFDPENFPIEDVKKLIIKQFVKQ